MTSKLWAIALTGLLSMTAVQADQAAAPDKPSISTTQKMKLTAQVTAIDMEARSVTLRAPESELPGVVASDTTISMATVEEINLEDSTFKLKWGEGKIKQYVAQDPKNLKKADVGDLVVVTYTEAVALTVQEVPTG